MKAAYGYDGKDNTYIHTLKGVGQWWSANFVYGKIKVSKVIIKTRATSASDIASSQITIDGKTCGSLPSSVSDG